MKPRISPIAALALALGFAAADHGRAQEYPAKPIRLIISSSPGSGVDTIARAVAQRMSEALGVQIIPDNRAGGGGTIGVQAVAKSPGDGYTLLMGAPSFTVNATLVKPPPYEFPRDFAAIGQATTAPYIVVVHPSLPVKSVKELIALARARPGQLNFGSGGTGNSTHLTGEYFKHLTQTDIVHIPYKGSGPAVVDPVSGQVQVTFASVASVLRFVQGDRLRALAVTSPERYAQLPEVPTMREAGVADVQLTSWYGLLAPAGTPPGVVKKIASDLAAVMASPALAKGFGAQGLDMVHDSPAEFAEFIREEAGKYARIAKAARIEQE